MSPVIINITPEQIEEIRANDRLANQVHALTERASTRASLSIGEAMSLNIGSLLSEGSETFDRSLTGLQQSALNELMAASSAAEILGRLDDAITDPKKAKPISRKAIGWALRETLHHEKKTMSSHTGLLQALGLSPDQSFELTPELKAALTKDLNRNARSFEALGSS